MDWNSLLTQYPGWTKALVIGFVLSELLSFVPASVTNAQGVLQLLVKGFNFLLEFSRSTPQLPSKLAEQILEIDNARSNTSTNTNGSNGESNTAPKTT